MFEPKAVCILIKADDAFANVVRRLALHPKESDGDSVGLGSMLNQLLSPDARHLGVRRA
jgi:hypothetical protein